ncbi:transferase family protein [Pseudovirgaria hyperparasitica]|uniref:Transferase family protein n=1 Tax=Pseudovirgaria hyperparasitica TaxID=470096 RepID=A0A6A6VVX5_9PEZI|nr:transferase family protein [Pseudovirgaria hyperparasitica]KAF2753864.1 transferase family protein [Pseudovirgaria hyperparasitica]
MDSTLNYLEPAKYELSPLDIIPSHLYISNVFFYANNDASNIDFMPRLRLEASLYASLWRFPILVGRAMRSGTSISIIVDPSDLNLPSFEETGSSTKFCEIREASFHRDSWPNGINVQDPRVNSSGTTIASYSKLLEVLIVRLAENSGVVIRIRIAHCVFDAKGCDQFYQDWANECSKRLPSHDPRRYHLPLLSRRFMYERLRADLQPPAREPWNLMTYMVAGLSLLLRCLLEVFVLFSKKQDSAAVLESHLFRVKRSFIEGVQHEAATLSLGTKVSSNDVIVSLFTMAFFQSSYPPSVKSSPPESLSAIVPCDFRHRLKVPERYSGSCAIGLYVTAPTSLLRLPISAKAVQPIAEVALISRNTVTEVSQASIETFLKRALRVITLLGHRANVLYASMVCQAFSNQTRLGYYDTDFGNGRPEFIAPMAYSNTVAVIMPSRPEANGDIDVFLTLRPWVMQQLLGNSDFSECIELVY